MEDERYRRDEIAEQAKEAIDKALRRRERPGGTVFIGLIIRPPKPGDDGIDLVNQLDRPGKE